MTKLRKKEALELCAALWEWLAENPTAKKHEWPQWAGNGGTVPEMLNMCPCCEYASERVAVPFLLDKEGVTCEHCPITKEAWDGGHVQGSKGFYCEYHKSPYHRWRRSKRPSARRKYALQVAQLAREALKEGA